MNASRILLVTGAIALAGWQATAQQTAPATTSDATAQPTAAVETPASPAAAAAPPAPALIPRDIPAAPKAKGKSKKVEYTGPTTIVELPPTPMLDEEGKQRLDPDGKPMWNAPVKQQRDKKGHPLFDEGGKPVFQTASELGYDEKGKKLHAKKEKEPKKIPVSIERGTMTVDGMTGKAALNYDIADFKYLYLYAPGIGVAIVSNEPFPGATEEKAAFNETQLTVLTGGHTLQLASDKRLLGKKPQSAYVLMDRQFTLPSRFPVMGYGTVRKAPYSWPGAKAYERAADVADFAPPPPADLMPVQLLKPCPSGQMRKPAPPTLPGQAPPVQPCVPIKVATPQTVAATKTAAAETAKN